MAQPYSFNLLAPNPLGSGLWQYQIPSDFTVDVREIDLVTDIFPGFYDFSIGFTESEGGGGLNLFWHSEMVVATFKEWSQWTGRMVIPPAWWLLCSSSTGGVQVSISGYALTGGPPLSPIWEAL